MPPLKIMEWNSKKVYRQYKTFQVKEECIESLTKSHKYAFFKTEKIQNLKKYIVHKCNPFQKRKKKKPHVTVLSSALFSAAVRGTDSLGNKWIQSVYAYVKLLWKNVWTCVLAVCVKYKSCSNVILYSAGSV